MSGKFHHERLYRGPELLDKLSKVRLVICGVGAIGSNLADNLVRQGAACVRAIDHDKVEEHNVSTQLYGESDVGIWKVETLRNRLFRASGVEIEAVRKELTEQNARRLLNDADLILDCFDNSRSRQLVQDVARSAGTACLHVGLHEDYCEAVWDEQYRVPQDARGDVCDYPLARNLVLLAVTVASESVMEFVGLGRRISRSATLRDLAICMMENK